MRTYLLIIIALGMVHPLLAQTEVMPSVERVKRAIRADNASNTYLKQAGAFFQLRSMLHALDGDRLNPLSASERALDIQFEAEYTKLVRAADIPQKPFNDKAKRLGHYQRAYSLRKEIYELLFEPGFEEKVDVLVSERYIYDNKPTPDFEAIKKAREDEEQNLKNRVFLYKSFFFLICITFFGFFTWFAFLRKKVIYPADDLYKVIIGRHSYGIYSFVGEVIHKEVYTKSYTQSSGNYETGFRTWTNSYKHDELMIRDEAGMERHVHWIDSGVPVRLGSILSALRVVKGNKKEGHYFLFKNHNTSQFEIRKHYIRQIFGAGWLPVLFLIPLSKVLMLSLVSSFSLGRVVSQDPMTALGELVSKETPSGGMLVFLIVVYLITNGIVMSVRYNRFVRERLPDILTDLNKRALKWADS